MYLDQEHQVDTLILSPRLARLDASVAVDVRNAALPLIDTATGDILLDLSQVVFMDSSGLGAIVGMMKRAGRERRFQLCGLTPGVEKVFRLTRMDRVFEISSTRAEALSGEAAAGAPGAGG
ncbi:STAS domain-containing protein [Oceanomicrobium pacificus]|uniref:Anti-sigma factor antagonist n=1 Tax=Oceanomicrobium pacificus TaxID=2692916 RepID=A0A6B0U0H0_9RHOB|nr:STAS domain-containing protein [Oceanomicrobium pacificus]MXU64631.1 anti-sigma factor antagonist [Oceanomicrobium pacificus]